MPSLVFEGIKDKIGQKLGETSVDVYFCMYILVDAKSSLNITAAVVVTDYTTLKDVYECTIKSAQREEKVEVRTPHAWLVEKR